MIDYQRDDSTRAPIAFRIGAEILSHASTTLSKLPSTDARSSQLERPECSAGPARHSEQMTEEQAASSVRQKSDMGSSPDGPDRFPRNDPLHPVETVLRLVPLAAQRQLRRSGPLLGELPSTVNGSRRYESNDSFRAANSLDGKFRVSCELPK